MSTLKVVEIQSPSNSNNSVSIASDSSVALKHSGNQKLVTSANGISITGECAATSVEDSKGDVRKIVQNSQTSAYSLVAADAGKHISITTGGVTIPASIFAAGDAITIINKQPPLIIICYLITI